MTLRTLRSPALVTFLALVPALALVETATVPPAAAMDFNAFTARLTKIEQAIEKFDNLANQPAPSNLTKAQQASWNKQSQMYKEISSKLGGFRDQFKELIRNAKGSPVDDKGLVSSFKQFHTQMVKDLNAFSPATPAGQTRHNVATNALNAVGG